MVAAPIALPDGGDGSLGVDGMSEKKLRNFEARVLGPEHAREHASARRVVRHRKAVLRREARKIRRMAPRCAGATCATSAGRRGSSGARPRCAPGRGRGAAELRRRVGSAGGFSLPVIGIHGDAVPTGKILYFAYPSSPFNGHPVFNIGAAAAGTRSPRPATGWTRRCCAIRRPGNMVPANICVRGPDPAGRRARPGRGGNLQFSGTKDWQGLEQRSTRSHVSTRRGRSSPTCATGVVPDGHDAARRARADPLGRDETGGDISTFARQGHRALHAVARHERRRTITLLGGCAGSPACRRTARYYRTCSSCPAARTLVAGAGRHRLLGGEPIGRPP